MKPQDVIGSWISRETIQTDGERKGRGLLKSKLDIDADGTAVVKTGFLKSKDTWRIENNALYLHNIGFDIDMGTVTLVGDELHLLTGNGIICVYTRQD